MTRCAALLAAYFIADVDKSSLRPATIMAQMTVVEAQPLRRVPFVTAFAIGFSSWLASRQSRTDALTAQMRILKSTCKHRLQ